MTIPEISPYLPSFANSKPAVSNPVFQAPAPAVQPFMAKREVEYVTGFDGANAVAMAPNSSGLFLDKDMNVLWVVATDQNGAKSVVKGYEIGNEYTPPKPVTLDDLMAQMQSMNERLNKMEETANGQYYHKSSGQGKPGGANAQPGGRNGSGDAVTKPGSDNSAN